MQNKNYDIPEYVGVAVNNSQLIELFHEFMVSSRGLSLATCSSYLADIRSLADYLKRENLQLVDVTSDIIECFLHSLKICSSSLARRISSYRQFYNFLCDEKIISTSPMVKSKAPMISQLSPLALSEQDIERLFTAAYADQSKIGIRTTVMLELLYSTGLRASEMLSLRLSDVLHNGAINDEVVVCGKGDKERLVIVNPGAKVILGQYISIWRPSTWLFAGNGKKGGAAHCNKPLTRQRLFDLFKKIATKAGIDHKVFSPHVMRHSFATHLLRNGLDIRVAQELLGHASIASTQIYTKMSAVELYDLVKLNHPLSGG